MFCKEFGSKITDGKFCSESGTPINTIHVPKEEKDEISNLIFLNFNDLTNLFV